AQRPVDLLSEVRRGDVTVAVRGVLAGDEHQVARGAGHVTVAEAGGVVQAVGVDDGVRHCDDPLWIVRLFGPWAGGYAAHNYLVGAPPTFRSGSFRIRTGKDRISGGKI